MHIESEAMPNIKLIGFSPEQAEDMIPKIAEAIRDKTSLAEKAVITNYPESTCVSVADITKSMPYFRIENTSEDGVNEEFEQLHELLKPFDFDIEWGDIKKFFATPEFDEWGT